MKYLITLLLLVSAVLAEYKSYDGYKVYKVAPEKQRHFSALRILSHMEEIDFWSEPRAGSPVIIMVAPNVQRIFEMLLHINKMVYEIIIENVATTVKKEQERQSQRKKVDGKVSFDAYYTYAEIQEYLDLIDWASDDVTIEKTATSYEGRELYLVKISANPAANNPIILVDGGIHAREWISPAFVTYIIDQLTKEENRALIENVDWYIIPVLNPDGYEYTHTNERFWRKTRSRGNVCYGVDGNRNFDFHWMETGASSNECSDIFAGPNAFSEKETSYLRDVVLENQDRIKLYLTFHSYGNYLLYPWGWTSALPDNWEQLHALAEDVDDAIASVEGTRYTIGSSTNVLYAAAGGSDDWVKGVGGVALSYTVELPGGGSQGFDLPASRILPVCIETFEGVKVYHEYVENNFKNTK